MDCPLYKQDDQLKFSLSLYILEGLTPCEIKAFILTEVNTQITTFCVMTSSQGRQVPFQRKILPPSSVLNLHPKDGAPASKEELKFSWHSL
jgi:hypothetical protein